MTVGHSARNVTGPDRALIVGLGSIGVRHLRLLRARLPKCKIMALRHSGCDDLCESLDLCTISLDEALAFTPQIAIISSPAPHHATSAVALARAGTHLLIEKPLAANIKDALQMEGAAARSGVLLQVGYNLRFLKSLRLFRDTLLAGRIGRVTSVRVEVGQYLPDWRPGRDWRKAVSAQADLGGGVLLELSHELDFLRWIFGEVNVVRGWMGRQGGLDIDVEDTVHAVLEFVNPTPLDAMGVPPTACVSMDFIRHDTTRLCVAIGEGGTLIWDGVESTVRLVFPDKSHILIYNSRPERDESYWMQLDAFLTGIRKGTTGMADVPYASDGVAVMQIVDALKRSHADAGRAMAPSRSDVEG